MKPARLATVVVLATTGGLLGAATAPASAATACASPVYKRQIYANTTFSGTPKQTGCDAAISENWGTGAPLPRMSADNFAVRWTVTRDFGSGGPFTFSIAAQDGVRVYVDGVRKADLWKNVSTTTKKTVNLSLSAGRHTLRVDHVHWTGRADVSFAYGPRTAATVDKVKPLTPTGFGVTYDPATGRARLTWAKNKEMDLAGYRVYRRPAAGTSWTRLLSTASLTHTDTTLPVTGASYAYQLRAYDKAGNESAGTAVRTVTTADRTGPAPVTGLSALGTTAGNSLTWKASADVHHYEVWAAPEGRSDPDGPETVFQASCTDRTAEAGTPYRYEIYALDAAGNISPVSAGLTVTRPVASAGPAPAGVLATPADASTTLTWTPGEGPTATGFRVYRRTAPTGAWSPLGSTSAPAYEDTTAPAGKAYYYVAAVDAAGSESVPSAEDVVERLTPATATGPAAPRLTVVSEGGTRFPIRVGIAPGAGDEGRVLRGHSWDVSGACGSSGTRLTTDGSLSWTPPYTGPCTVTVRAVDAYGRPGEQSASVEVMVSR